MTFDVWHQWRPVVFVEKSVGLDGKTMDFFAPALAHRGQVVADDGAAAIHLAKLSGMSMAPIVKQAKGNGHG